MLQEYDPDWLINLRDDKTPTTSLIKLPGVGPKVADCVALFSLNQLNLVPVDTHVFQIAQRYIPGLDKKKMSTEVYAQIRSFFSSTFGELAGWAHTILFAAELSPFKKGVQEKKKENGKQTKRAGKKEKKPQAVLQPLDFKEINVNTEMKQRGRGKRILSETEAPRKKRKT